VAKCAMFYWKQFQFGLKCFMFAGLASIVIFNMNALARSNARRIVTSTLSTVNIAKAKD